MPILLLVSLLTCIFIFFGTYFELDDEVDGVAQLEQDVIVLLLDLLDED